MTLIIYIKLAWRNIFRNKRRTILSGIAIGAGLAMMIFSDGLIIGIIESIIKSTTNTFAGQGVIHADGFRNNYDPELVVNNIGTVKERLAKERILKDYTERTQIFAMVSSQTDASSVVLYGIDPVHERGVSNIGRAVIAGSYIDDENGGQIMIGARLAGALDVRIGDKLVVTLAQPKSGELISDLFRVGAIFRTNSKEMDSGMAFIGIGRSRSMLGMKDGANEIVLKFHDINNSGNLNLDFWKRYSTDGNEAIGWRKMFPQLNSMLDMIWMKELVIFTVIFAIVALLVMSTLFMSLYERFFEFGVMRSLGTRPLGLVAIIMLESLSLAVISIVIGGILGLAIGYYFSIHGLTYLSGIDMGGTTILDPIYMVLQPRQFLYNPLYLIIFALIASIYPAIYAARLRPAEAMKRSL